MQLNVTAVFIFISLTTGMLGYSQKKESTDYYAGIKMHDLTTVWYSDGDQPKTDSNAAVLPEPPGFIGINYQRFYIHFTAVQKSKTNPYEYIVAGKTKVKENICRFSGIIIL